MWLFFVSFSFPFFSCFLFCLYPLLILPGDDTFLWLLFLSDFSFFLLSLLFSPAVFLASTVTNGPETEHFVVRSTEPFKGKRDLRAKTKTSISVGVRKASYFCSSCKDQIWHACRVAVKFPDLVGNMREEKLGVVKSTYSFGTQSDLIIVESSPFCVSTSEPRALIHDARGLSF